MLNKYIYRIEKEILIIAKINISAEYNFDLCSYFQRYIKYIFQINLLIY